MVKAAEEITLTPEQETIVTAFRKQYPEASRFTAVKFCFGRKFELQRIFPLYEGYRAIVKERNLENITATDVLQELRTQKMYIPGTRDKKGAALFVVQANKHVIGQFPPESTIKLAFYLGECVTASLKTQRNGLTLIIDLTGTEWASFDANFMAEIIGFFQNHIPAAVKNILIWRAPWWIKTAIQIVSPFLKEKMRKRINLCDNLYGLLEFIDESDLPMEFGGSFEYDHDQFIRKELSKSSTEDILSALTDSKEATDSIEITGEKRILVMAGAVCAVSPNLEEELQQEREFLITEIDNQIELLNQQNQVNFNIYPVPIHDLMQNKIYRMTLDLDSSAATKTTAAAVESSELERAWRQAQTVKSDQERIKLLKEAIYLEKKEFLIKN